MIQFHYPVIVRGAFVPLVILVILALIVHYQLGLFMGFWIWGVVVLFMFFFRDPRRQIPPVPLAIVSPVDGVVSSVDTVKDPYLNRSAIRIQMQGNLIGAYVVRSVTEGKVKQQWFGKLPSVDEQGIYSESGVPKFAQWTQSDEGDDVVTTLSPKILSAGTRCGVSSGERIGQGKPCTFIPFGSNAEVLLADNSRVEVKPGDKINAGSSIIASLIH